MLDQESNSFPFLKRYYKYFVLVYFLLFIFCIGFGIVWQVFANDILGVNFFPAPMHDSYNDCQNYFAI